MLGSLVSKITCVFFLLLVYLFYYYHFNRKILNQENLKVNAENETKYGTKNAFLFSQTMCKFLVSKEKVAPTELKLQMLPF